MQHGCSRAAADGRASPLGHSQRVACAGPVGVRTGRVLARRHCLAAVPAACVSVFGARACPPHACWRPARADCSIVTPGEFCCFLPPPPPPRPPAHTLSHTHTHTRMSGTQSKGRMLADCSYLAAVPAACVFVFGAWACPLMLGQHGLIAALLPQEYFAAGCPPLVGNLPTHPPPPPPPPAAPGASRAVTSLSPLSMVHIWQGGWWQDITTLLQHRPCASVYLVARLASFACNGHSHQE